MKQTSSDNLRRMINTAGSWFLLTQVECILDWTAEDSLLAETLYQKGFDRDLSGTRTRVNAIRRLIENDMLGAAIEYIGNSPNVNRAHPEAHQLAQDVLERRFGLKEK